MLQLSGRQKKYRQKHEERSSKNHRRQPLQLSTVSRAHTHTPVLHASVFPRRLFERDVARGEGAEAAGDDGHGAELGPGLVDHVGAGGVLLAVLAIPPLQVVVRAGDGHLHGCSFQSKSEDGTDGDGSVGFT